MPAIRIPQEHGGEVWFALVSSGPISRVSEEPIYFVSDRQVRMLRKKKLPFQLLSNSKGRVTSLLPVARRLGSDFQLLSNSKGRVTDNEHA